MPVKHRYSNRIIPGIVVCGILLLIWQALADGRGEADKDSLFSRLLQTGRDQSIQEWLPVLAEHGRYEEEQEGTILQAEAIALQEDSLEQWLPGYLYQTQAGQVAVRQVASEESEEQELYMEEGTSDRELSLEELMELENQSQLHEQEGVVVLDMERLLEENGWNTADSSADESADESAESSVVEEWAVQGIQEIGNKDPMVADSGFVPHIRQQTVDLTALQDYETLRNQFYAVDSVTNIGRELLDVEKLTQRDLTISKEDEGPQILIYHTHSQEGFADSIPGDDTTTIMGVGQHLADILEEQYGYQVLHHLGTYDKESRDNAYSRSLPEITELLEEYPQIQVVIDLHRDAVAEETHLVMDLDGRPTARFMFFNGISWTRRTGSISYLQNDNLPDNLAFSFQMKLKAEEYYPGLTRRNYINGYRYNMHLRPRTLLIELGAQNNTLEEAMNACDPIAHLLDLVLSGSRSHLA